MTNITVAVYDYDPFFDFPNTIGATFSYAGPEDPETTIDITDTGDDDQTLEWFGEESATGTITINGATSTDVPISSFETWTLRDTSTNLEFEVSTLFVQGGAAFGYYLTSEVPLSAGQTYEVAKYAALLESDEGDPVFSYSDYVCFAPDTLIETPTGPRKVQNLVAGDQILTLDNGPQRLIWTGKRKLEFGKAPHTQKPIMIKEGALGEHCPDADLVVSPQHRILLKGDVLAREHGQQECLGMAKGLLPFSGVRSMKGKRHVTYHTLLTERHEIVFANGLAVETFYPGRYAMTLLTPKERIYIRAALPQLSGNVEASYGEPARKTLKRREVERLRGVYGIPSVTLDETALTQ